jgi:hypothetical protein
MPKPTEETLIEELVGDAFKPFEGLLPPDVLGVFRGELADALATHPQGARLVRRALPDPVVHGSGDVSRGAASEEDLERKRKRGGGPRGA